MSVLYNINFILNPIFVKAGPAHFRFQLIMTRSLSNYQFTLISKKVLQFSA
jgi:hypothetical protein